MIRRVLLTAVLIAFGSSMVVAQGYSRGHRHHPRPYAVTPSPSIAANSPYRAFGAGALDASGLAFGNPRAYPIDGANGVYLDPYARGRFDMPDLTKDPYFQWQHKFDSHFPGRYTRGADGRMYRHPRKGFFGGW